MTIELRGAQRGQWDRIFDTLMRAFHGSAGADADDERALWADLAQWARMTTAWDGDELVGTAGLYSFTMTVPGGDPLKVAGVSMVTVQPTHTRRGVLTSMMRRQLDALRDGGESVAILTASEPAIYGRFGYGVATRETRGRVDTARVTIAAPEGAGAVRLRLVPPGDAKADCEAVYARLVPRRAGMLARASGWDAVPLLPGADRSAGPLLCVLASVDGEVRGYARYSVTRSGSAAGPSSTVNLRDIAALDPAAYAALWRYLTSIDLTTQVSFANLPADDPLLHLVSDQRRCSLTSRDSMHLRVVDVGAALSARTYSRPVDAVLEVTDAFCPWSTGRWRLTGDAEGAACARTTDPADLALTAKELGAAYLGGPSLRAMAAAGLVHESRPGALSATADAFLTDPAPWLPHAF